MMYIRTLSYLLFLFSGFAALVYQVTWTRQVATVFGSTSESTGVVLAVFMAGLALGGVVIGRIADRVRHPFLVFAVLEGILGLYGLAAPLLFKGISGFFAEEGAFPGITDKVLVVLLYLLVPCFILGGTLPALSRYCVTGERERERTGLVAGGLYTTNTLGAALGALMTGFLFLEHLGLAASIHTAAVVNLVLCGTALGLFFIEYTGSSTGEGDLTGETETDPDAASPPETSPGTLPAEALTPKRILGRILVAVALILAGASTLGHEVLWTRILSQFFRNSVYSFATMLFAVLLGLALGGGVGAILSRRIRRAGIALALTQVLAATASLAMMHLVTRYTDLTSYRALIRDFGGFESFTRLAMFEVLVALVLVLLPAFFMGMTFPLAARLAWRPLSRFGGFVGDVQLVLTLGSVVGALAMAFFLIPGNLNFEETRWEWLFASKKGLVLCLFAVTGANLLAAVLLWIRDLLNVDEINSASSPKPIRPGIRWIPRIAVLVVAVLALVVYGALPDLLIFWKDRPDEPLENLVTYMSDRGARWPWWLEMTGSC